MPTKNKLEWFKTCLGQYLLEREQNHFDEAVADVFGYNAMQIGFPQYDFLRANRMPLQFCTGIEGGAAVRASPEFLPIETNSIDLVLLPHVLEYSANPHQILREVQRVLMPEGQVIVCGFNPRSLWGARGVLGSLEERFFRPVEKQFPWRGDFISLPRLKAMTSSGFCFPTEPTGIPPSSSARIPTCFNERRAAAGISNLGLRPSSSSS